MDNMDDFQRHRLWHNKHSNEAERCNLKEDSFSTSFSCHVELVWQFILCQTFGVYLEYIPNILIFLRDKKETHSQKVRSSVSCHLQLLGLAFR
jgi:hypothetical protein